MKSSLVTILLLYKVCSHSPQFVHCIYSTSSVVSLSSSCKHTLQRCGSYIWRVFLHLLMSSRDGLLIVLADDSLRFLVDKSLCCFSHFTFGRYKCFACSVLLVNLSLDSSTDTAAFTCTSAVFSTSSFTHGWTSCCSLRMLACRCVLVGMEEEDRTWEK